MKQTVSVKELKSGGYTRFPRLFIDLLLQDYYPKNKTRLKIGVFIYIFGKLANKPYNYRYAGGKRVSIYEGQCIIHITTMARALGCSLYAARKALNELAAQRGQTLAEMSLAWLLNHEAVTSVLIGASKPSQILDNIKAAENTSFTAEELAKIEEISI